MRAEQVTIYTLTIMWDVLPSHSYLLVLLSYTAANINKFCNLEHSLSQYVRVIIENKSLSRVAECGFDQTKATLTTKHQRTIVLILHRPFDTKHLSINTITLKQFDHLAFTYSVFLVQFAANTSNNSCNFFTAFSSYRIILISYHTFTYNCLDLRHVYYCCNWRNYQVYYYMVESKYYDI